jgi:uncharacterized protein (DUF488 family)
VTTIYTVGHGNRTLDDFIAVLNEAGIGLLADVRRYPRSRRNPQFSRESLERSLAAKGVEYSWRGEELGGRRDSSGESRHTALRNTSFRAYADYMDTNEFANALAQLVTDANGDRVAVMCAERSWWRCHRRHIADALVVEGMNVIHLVDVGESHEHVPHQAMRTDVQGRPVYDVGETGTLWA